MLPLPSRSVHMFRAGVAIRKDIGEQANSGNDSFEPKCYCFHTVRDFLHRPSFLNITGEEGNHSTGANDGDHEPDQPAKRPAKTVLLPHGDHREGDAGYSEEYD